jgi:hypothetical protein
VDNTETAKMPVFYNADEEEVCQNGQPNFGNNANFRNNCDHNNRNNSNTEASSTGHHIGDLFRRHRMNQAKAQNNVRQDWFQCTCDQQNREQVNNVFDHIRRQNLHNANMHRDQHHQCKMGQDQQYHQNAAPQKPGNISTFPN